MLPQSSPLKTFLNYRNNLMMMYKNLPPCRRKRILFIRMALDGISAVHSLLKGDVSILKAVWKAHNSYRKLRRNYRLPTDNTGMAFSHLSCVYQRSAAYQYFIRGRKTFESLGKI